MSEKPTHTPPRWVSRIFHGAILGVLLMAVGFRVYAYFLTPESAVESPHQQWTTETGKELSRVAAKAFEQRDWPRAADAYGQIVERQPDNVFAWTHMAHALLASGQYDAALSALVRCCEFGGQARRWALYNIACVYALKGEKRLALDYLTETAEAGFRSERSITDDPDLQSLADDPEFHRLAEVLKPIALRNVYHRYDFLMGDWNLMGERGERIGHFQVEQVSPGHALRGCLEDDLQRSTRTLFAYYDPAIGNWKQLWLDTHGNVVQLQGLEGASATFAFEGELVSADGARQPARAEYREDEQGAIRIAMEVTPDAGVTWAPLLHATLVARKSVHRAPSTHVQAESP